MPGMKFAMTISAMDCSGCGSCAQVCPGMKGEKALVMKPMETQPVSYTHLVTSSTMPMVKRFFGDSDSMLRYTATIWPGVVSLEPRP